MTVKQGQYLNQDALVRRNYKLRMLDEKTYRITTTEDITPTEFYIESEKELADGVYEITGVGKNWNKTEYDTLLTMVIGNGDILSVNKQPLPNMRKIETPSQTPRKKLTDLLAA